MSHQLCVLCEKKDKVSNLQKLSEKGATSLNTAINKRKDIDKQVCVGQYAHNNCRKNCASERKILQSLSKQISGACNSAAFVATESNISRRTSTFDFNNTCFFCGESTSNNSNQKKKLLSQGVKMMSNCLPTPNQFHVYEMFL